MLMNVDPRWSVDIFKVDSPSAATPISNATFIGRQKKAAYEAVLRL